ncbi:MAG: hypothetical protein A2X45_15460 [Lentisphaerae bacterium GWF2_50_93]|nr:MAG: hypothetical protein A2X45_15460 [Lentisphaerae bacterium GWF2_50_93]
MKTFNTISLLIAVAATAFLSFATQAAAPSEKATYTYDENNCLTKVIYSNGRTANFSYDKNGNLTNVTTDGGAAEISLKSGTAITAISGLKGANKLYTIDVIDGQDLLEIKVSKGTGECDLEVRNSNGTVKKYSLNTGNSETIRISDPAQGKWTITLLCRTDVSGLSLVAKYYSGIPAAPAGLKATDGTFTDKIVLTWTESAGTSSYVIYRNDTGKTSGGANPIAEVEDTTYTDVGTVATPLDAAKTYTYFLKAKRSATASTLFSAGDAGYITKKPLPPATVTASDGTYFDKIRVTWTASLGASSYDVERYTDAALSALDDTFADITGLSYDDVSCEIGTTYYYAVIAKNANDSSLKSKGNAGILSKKGPASIKATSGTIYNNVRVSWAAVPGATSYKVYIDLDPAIDTGSSLTAYEHVPGDLIAHKYKVTAAYLANESDPSPIATGKAGTHPAKPAAPVLKSASMDLYKYVRLTWGEVGLAEQYKIYRQPSTVTTFTGATLIATVDIPTLSYDNLPTGPNSVTPGTKYNYWVTAVNSASATQESLPSAMKSGRAAADIEGGVPLTSGIPVTSISGGQGESKYYSIVVPAGTTRLVARLTGTTNAVANDCNLFLKYGCYPTTTSYNAKGTESTSGETAIVTNPATGTWYIMLYGVTVYSDVTLKVDCYSAADIILTQVPLNNQAVPLLLANFKGRVVDEVGTGIPGLYIKVRDPIKGTVTTLATKTDATGYFTYSTTVNLEGEHTYDFFFANFPDTAKGTASHTVSTKIGASAAYSELFDAPSYLPATPVALANLADTTGMQTFLNIRNGWSSTGPIDTTYEDMWVNSTIIKTSTDSAIADRCTDGLFIVFYGVEGAGAGNDTTATSALSTVPLVVHITPANLIDVLNTLEGMSVISAAQETEILAGGIGIIAVAVLKDPDEAALTPSDLSLLPADQLSLISDFISNTNTVPAVPATADYSGITTHVFTISLNGGSRKISIVTVAY